MTLTKTYLFIAKLKITLETESHSNRVSTCLARDSTTTVVVDVFSFVSKRIITLLVIIVGYA